MIYERKGMYYNFKVPNKCILPTLKETQYSNAFCVFNIYYFHKSKHISNIFDLKYEINSGAGHIDGSILMFVIII